MSGQQDVMYIESGGLKRRYVMYRPDSVVLHGSLAPAVIMLDGRGGTPWTAMKTTRLNQKADEAGFVAVYPEATRLDPGGPLHFLTNPQMWNAGTGLSDAERSQVDDVTFLDDVIADACGHARLDPTRIYMTGFSNGAAMTFRFALHHPGCLAAIAPVAGHAVVGEQTLAEPVPMIGFFGMQDPLSPFGGGGVTLPWGRVERRPPVRRTIETWASLCGHPAENVRISEEGQVTFFRYGKFGDRDEIEYLAVHDLGHVWPGGHRLLPEALVGSGSMTVSATDAMWTFFHRHRRPG